MDLLITNLQSNHISARTKLIINMLENIRVYRLIAIYR